MYSSPDETLRALEEVGYFADLKTATTVYLAGRIHRPIMLEGPAGSGKTELPSSVARAYRVPLLRLQCYQGINEEKAIGQYDRSLQEFYVLLMSKSDRDPDWAQIKREVTSRAYFMAGPLLEAIEQGLPCVLLIDEIDKVDYAFEAMLLELLSDWTLSIPKMGTVQATSIPHVFLTSNQSDGSETRCGGEASTWSSNIRRRNGRQRL
jgi:MoxR-like ATPase